MKVGFKKMLFENGRPWHRPIAKQLLVAGLALLFTFSFFSPPVYAQQSHQLAEEPSILSVQAGFNGFYHTGNWIPIQVKVNNNGNPFDGTISVSFSTPYTGNNPSSTNISLYQTAISLPAISQKLVTLYVPIDVAGNGQGTPNSLTIHLQDNNNHEVTSKTVSITPIAPNELYIGLISDQSLDVKQLTGALSGQNVHPRVEPLATSTLPTAVAALNNFDLLILDNATTSTLSNDQRTALQGWVNQGGTLVEVGGPEWHNTLGSLPNSLLPVTLTGTDTVAAGQHLLPQNGNTAGTNGTNDTLPTGVPISVATPKPGSLVLLASNNIPLIVQANSGQGLVYYLAYDPFLDPLVTWTNTSNLWSNLLMRTLGDQILTMDNGNLGDNNLATSKYGLYGNINNFLESLVPNAFPPIWLILTLLISYVSILGPLRFLLIRWGAARGTRSARGAESTQGAGSARGTGQGPALSAPTKKAWSWRIVVATIVLFSLLSYGLALQVKGTSVVSSKVSVLQLSQPDGSGSQAHVTDFAGVYVPGQGDFHVHIPGTRLVETIDQASPYYSGFYEQPSRQKTVITTQANSTDADLQGVDTWTLRTLTTKYDTHIQGGITSNLSFSQNTITGTVTNTLPYSLNDAYLLVGAAYIAVGNLASGQTKSVQLTVKNPTDNQYNGTLPNRLAYQIANSKGVNVNQYSNSPFNSNPSTDENSRHARMLLTLDGSNCNIGPCFQNYSKGPIGNGPGSPLQPHVLDGPERSYAQDPLLIAGAPATIIGWINNSPDTMNITINNGTAPGTQESLVQAPLNLHFTGTVDVPPALSTGQIVDVQPGPNSNNWPQAVESGVYSLTTGSMTFEIQLPVTGNLQAQTLTFNENTAASQSPNVNLGQGATNDANAMSIGLYNWQTNTWDSKAFNADTFTVDDAQHYIDPNGRVLIQFTNSQNSQIPAVFTMPGVELNATIDGQG